MGTWPEWKRVITEATYWTLFMFPTFWLLNYRTDKDRRRERVPSFIASLCVGILSGLTDTFHSRLWHWPLSIVSMSLLLSFLGIVLAFRREVASNWRRDWEIFGPPPKRVPPWSKL
jgi:hypothetical protein